MLYYRIALRTTQTRKWRWQSTKLVSFNDVIAFIRTYRHLPHGSLRVFRSSSLEILEQMLARENQGLPSCSVPAEEILQGNHLDCLQVMRLESEFSIAGDSDQAYTFTLPTSVLQQLAWSRLMVKIRCGELVP